jgi:hypothetical protein
MNNYLIINGGSAGWSNSAFSDKQYYMLINSADGTLGPVLTATLPAAMKRYSPSAVVFKNKMYLVTINLYVPVIVLLLINFVDTGVTVPVLFNFLFC